MTMSSLVQRQSERQGIFLVALSPFKRGAGGVKYRPLTYSPPKILGGVRGGFIHPRPIFRHIAKLSIYNHFNFCYHKIREDKCN